MNQQLAIPARFRAWVYGLYGLLSLGCAAAAVGFGSAEQSQPTWLKVSTAVVVFLGPAIGYTAASHTPAAPDAAPAVVPDASPNMEG